MASNVGMCLFDHSYNRVLKSVTPYSYNTLTWQMRRTEGVRVGLGPFCRVRSVVLSLPGSLASYFFASYACMHDCTGRYLHPRLKKVGACMYTYVWALISCVPQKNTSVSFYFLVLGFLHIFFLFYFSFFFFSVFYFSFRCDSCSHWKIVHRLLCSLFKIFQK